MLAFWSEQVTVKLMECNEFSIELQVCTEDGQESFWITFVHASTNARIRKSQWDTQINKKQFWGEKWIVGGDFNVIKNQEEKMWGRRRSESSFVSFRDFIVTMGMGEIKFKSESWTQANNREGEGFIKERLDKFFGSAEWLLYFDKAEVKHFLRQASNHSFIVLDSNPKYKIEIYI